MKDIVDLSSTLLNDFELNILNKRSEEVKVGKCFLKNCEKIRVIYSNYAQSIEYSNNILEKVLHKNIEKKIHFNFFLNFRMKILLLISLKMDLK